MTTFEATVDGSIFDVAVTVSAVTPSAGGNLDIAVSATALVTTVMNMVNLMRGEATASLPGVTKVVIGTESQDEALQETVLEEIQD